MNVKNKFSVKKMAWVGLLSALVFVASLISIPISTGIDNTRIHLGNVMCLLSGMMLGPIGGGLAAGIGSFFFDLTNPLYISTAPLTFIFKFTMAFICGLISQRGDNSLSFKRNTAAAICGAIAYIILYLTKSFVYDYYFLKMEIITVKIDVSTKAVTSLINGIIAAVISVPLNHSIQKALNKLGIGLRNRT